CGVALGPRGAPKGARPARERPVLKRWDQAQACVREGCGSARWLGQCAKLSARRGPPLGIARKKGLGSGFFVGIEGVLEHLAGQSDGREPVPPPCTWVFSRGLQPAEGENREAGGSTPASA